MATRLPRTALSYLLLILVLSELGYLSTAEAKDIASLHVVLSYVAHTSFILICFVGLAVSSLREKALLSVSVLLTAILIAEPDAYTVFSEAVDIAAFFGVFIAMLTIMKEAATRSRSVSDVGIYLTSQPPGRRYFSVAVGSHILGAFLNFSAVSLISPLIQKGAKSSKTERASDLERRQLSALIRGFSWILLWAPTTLTQAVLLSLFTDIDYVQLITATAIGTLKKSAMTGIAMTGAPAPVAPLRMPPKAKPSAIYRISIPIGGFLLT